jgi:hypothetical protein
LDSYLASDAFISVRKEVTVTPQASTGKTGTGTGTGTGMGKTETETKEKRREERRGEERRGEERRGENIQSVTAAIGMYHAMSWHEIM